MEEGLQTSIVHGTVPTQRTVSSLYIGLYGGGFADKHRTWNCSNSENCILSIYRIVYRIVWRRVCRQASYMELFQPWRTVSSLYIGLYGGGFADKHPTWNCSNPSDLYPLYFHQFLCLYQVCIMYF